MAGNHSTTSQFNKNILLHDLNLRQISNTTAYYKNGFFVLSPSIQNSYHWFDIREVNLARYRQQSENGYLLVRFFDKFLLAELDEFIDRMISNDNYVETKVSGVHWKFIIHERGQEYIIVNQTDKKRFSLKGISLEQLKIKFNGSPEVFSETPTVRKPVSRKKENSIFTFFAKIFK
jgi:hypothetical protein